MASAAAAGTALVEILLSGLVSAPGVESSDSKVSEQAFADLFSDSFSEETANEDRESHGSAEAAEQVMLPVSLPVWLPVPVPVEPLLVGSPMGGLPSVVSAPEWPPAEASTTDGTRSEQTPPRPNPQVLPECILVSDPIGNDLMADPPLDGAFPLFSEPAESSTPARGQDSEGAYGIRREDNAFPERPIGEEIPLLQEVAPVRANNTVAPISHASVVARFAIAETRSDGKDQAAAADFAPLPVRPDDPGQRSDVSQGPISLPPAFQRRAESPPQAKGPAPQRLEAVQLLPQVAVAESTSESISLRVRVSTEAPQAVEPTEIREVAALTPKHVPRRAESSEAVVSNDQKNPAEPHQPIRQEAVQMDAQPARRYYRARPVERRVLTRDANHAVWRERQPSPAETVEPEITWPDSETIMAVEHHSEARPVAPLPEPAEAIAVYASPLFPVASGQHALPDVEMESRPAADPVPRPAVQEREIVRPVPLQQLSIAVQGPNEEPVRLVIREAHEARNNSVEISVRTSDRTLDSLLRQQSGDLLARFSRQGLDAELLPIRGPFVDAPVERRETAVGSGSIEQFSHASDDERRVPGSTAAEDRMRTTFGSGDESAERPGPQRGTPWQSGASLAHETMARDGAMNDHRRRQPRPGFERARVRRSTGAADFSIHAGMEDLRS
jgi:hypothetical protein